MPPAVNKLFTPPTSSYIQPFRFGSGIVRFMCHTRRPTLPHTSVDITSSREFSFSRCLRLVRWQAQQNAYCWCVWFWIYIYIIRVCERVLIADMHRAHSRRSGAKNAREHNNPISVICSTVQTFHAPKKERMANLSNSCVMLVWRAQNETSWCSAKFALFRLGYRWKQFPWTLWLMRFGIVFILAKVIGVTLLGWL